jgi:hypothetical protein
VSGLPLISCEFLLYAIFGSLLATSLYVYAFRLFKNGAFLAVAAFFISMFYFLNYQAVPFTFALALLFVLFMLETRKKSAPIIITMLVLFFSISIAHSFVGLFFIIYLLFRWITTRSKLYAELSAVTTSIFLVSQFTLGSYWLGFNVTNLFRLPTDYGSIVTTTLKTVAAPAPIDTFSQTVSRAITVMIVLLCFVGFVLMLIRRKLRGVDGAIFLAGISYSIAGLALSSLGERAISILFIPLSLGVTYLFQTKYRLYFAGLFLILVMCFVAVPIHSSFNASSPTTYLTKEHLVTANFMLEKYDWRLKSNVIADDGICYYVSTQIHGSTIVDSSLTPHFGLKSITNYDAIIYSVDLAKNLQSSGLSIENTSEQISQRCSLVYNSGSSYIAIKSR